MPANKVPCGNSGGIGFAVIFVGGVGFSPLRLDETEKTLRGARERRRNVAKGYRWLLVLKRAYFAPPPTGGNGTKK